MLLQRRDSNLAGPENGSDPLRRDCRGFLTRSAVRWRSRRRRPSSSSSPARSGPAATRPGVSTTTRGRSPRSTPTPRLRWRRPADSPVASPLCPGPKCPAPSNSENCVRGSQRWSGARGLCGRGAFRSGRSKIYIHSSVWHKNLLRSIVAREIAIVKLLHIATSLCSSKIQDKRTRGKLEDVDSVAVSTFKAIVDGNNVST